MQLWRFPISSFLLGTSSSDHPCIVFSTRSAFLQLSLGQSPVSTEDREEQSAAVQTQRHGEGRPAVLSASQAAWEGLQLLTLQAHPATLHSACRNSLLLCDNACVAPQLWSVFATASGHKRHSSLSYCSQPGHAHMSMSSMLCTTNLATSAGLGFFSLIHLCCLSLRSLTRA